MPGATIDHLISLTIFIAALVLFVSLFSQNLQAAILYQRNRQVSIKAADILNSISLNPGYPTNWGRSSTFPTSFGLQDPNARGYTLSPFSLMRLASASGNPVQLKTTGQWYSNVSMGYGGYLLVPFNMCVNYTMATRLMGVNGSYGFQLTVTPILTISIKELNPSNPLRVEVKVSGPGLPLGNAYIEYNLVYVDGSQGHGADPGFQIFSGTARTFVNGTAPLVFGGVTDPDGAYAVIVNAHLGGLFGIGYMEHSSPSMEEVGDVIPFVENFEEGRITLVHSYDVHEVPNPSALHFNATFLVLSADFKFHTIQVGNGTVTGIVNYGAGGSEDIQIPSSDPGVLIVTYRKDRNTNGISLLPWGIGSLGVSLVYGENPSDRDWVATDIRQVVIAGVSYQVKIAVWSLAGFQVYNPTWRP